MELINLTKKQNEQLKALHIKAIDDAQAYLKSYVITRSRKDSELVECELAKAKAYWELGNFEEDPRYREM
ncbi:hypothetical protein [Veillonella sp. CHU594]|uniref:hypothetical protein n=1 Tax=Veillonella sp. CHU594 TaxID=2490948 RepID=UPI000F8F6676|nr:hypothetical protein [Veillonella sp. CHU594]